MLRLSAAALALSLFGVACASGDGGSDAASGGSGSSMASEAPETAETAEAPAVDTPAATLTRDLTSLLAGK